MLFLGGKPQVSGLQALRAFFMKKLFGLAVAIFMFSGLGAQFRVQVWLESKSGINQLDPVFMAGSFNGWNPRDTHYVSRLDTLSHRWYIPFNLPGGSYEFKFTRGSWQQAECGLQGAFLENRNMVCTILGWSDQFPLPVKKHTARPEVRVLDSAFFMPQLGRSRRIWIYLPPGYAGSSRSYPVLYMQDGQNLFDEATAANGEWGVDEIMDSLSEHNRGCIIVAIDHGGEKRLSEYNPFDHPVYGPGQGNGYADFLALTLKPYIDRHFRTLRGPAHNYLCGSSMGGLISLYTLLIHPRVFGGAGIFSPALWIAPSLKKVVSGRISGMHASIYLYGGGQESASMERDLHALFNLLRGHPGIRLKLHINKAGRHNESSWRKEFPAFFQWMMIR